MLSRLRRITSDGRWIPEVDGLRFLAISSVFLFHVMSELIKRSGHILPIEPNYWWLDRILSNGNRGVDLFFVISGMILALPFARHSLLGQEPVSLRKYYLRRLTRLEPPYIASMMLAALMMAAYWHGLPAGFASHLLASVFYQHNILYGQPSPVNPVTWSLEIEVQFYVLAPLIMQFFRIRPTQIRRILLIVCIFVTGVAQIPFYVSPRFEISILFYLQYFLAGLLVADIYVLDLNTMPSSWIWDVAGIAALAAIFWTPNDVLWPHILLPAAFALLCVAVMRSYGIRPAVANPWIAVTGGMCYSIYLLHFLFIAALFKLTRHAILPGATFLANYAIQLLLLAVPVFLVSSAFYLIVERPCMEPDWPSKLRRRLAHLAP
jgi:peptidoglycan/LPS O-acetylase OafA/YrhL